MIQTILNTLFVQTQGAYLHLDHDTVKVEAEKELLLQVPLHHLKGIAVFGNVLISPFLLHRCASDGRDVIWFNVHGRFRGRLAGPTSGNVLLRTAQYEKSGKTQAALLLAKRFVEGKIRGACGVLNRAYRDYSDEYLKKTSSELTHSLHTLSGKDTIDAIRGVEGMAANRYFAAFAKLIRVEQFTFIGRIKRPPRDPVNAILSFTYTLLANDCVSALEAVGLDPQVGFLHALRPGKPSLALDLMEEFRAAFADRLVLTLLNRQQLHADDFEERPGGSVLLNEKGRKSLLVAYQKRKQEEVAHTLFKKHVAIGQLPYIQARLLARYIRGDLDDYRPYRWR